MQLHNKEDPHKNNSEFEAPCQSGVRNHLPTPPPLSLFRGTEQKRPLVLVSPAFWWYFYKEVTTRGPQASKGFTTTTTAPHVVVRGANCPSH